MMMYTPRKKHSNVSYRTWGLLLFVVWLSLHTVVFAESEGDLEPAKMVPPVEAFLPKGAVSTQTGGVTFAELVNKVIKTDVRYMVDFSYLHSIAPNGIAWLYQPNTTINQPVMFGNDPDYYLRRQFNDRISPNGSLFMKGEEKPDFSAPITTIFGRNCLDFSLFGSFSYYQEEAYYEENPTLYLLTPQGDYQLDIFAGIRTKVAGDNTWQVSQTSAEALWAEDLPRILEKSFITPKPYFLPTEADEWVLLATEFYEKQGRTRYIIYARKRSIDYQTDRIAYVNEVDMDSRITLNGYVSVKNVGEWMLYAQNDPSWNKLVFEVQNSSRKRPFGDGGYGPKVERV